MENIEKRMLVRTIIRREPSSNDGTRFVKLFNIVIRKRPT